MFRKITLVFYCFCFLVGYAQAQRDADRIKDVAFKVGSIGQGTPFFNPWYGEVGVALIDRPSNKFREMSFNSFELGTEFAVTPNHLILAPKFTVAAYLMVAEVKLSAATYLKGEMVDVRVIPEVGISGGLWGFFIGWNAPVTPNTIEDLALFKLSTVIRIPVLKLKRK